MAKLEYFQPINQANIASWTNEGYIDAQGVSRWTSLTYYDNNNALVGQVQGFDIPEADIWAANSFQPILAGDDIMDGSWGNDELLGYAGMDVIDAQWGDDFIHGMHGKDVMRAGGGNDTCRGGHGHDEMWGEGGEDFLWGGIGQNRMYAGDVDGDKDDLYVSVDSINNAHGNPDGVNCDLLYEVGLEDSIWIHGIDDAALTYVDGVTDPNGSGSSGVGIEVNGVLEALVVGGLSTFQVNAMTTGGFF